MIEQMKQWLEALEVEQTVYLRAKLPVPVYLTKATTSLRQAIAEAEKQDGNCQHCGGKGCVACDARKQEPVMWVMPDGKTVDKWGLQFYGGQTGKPLYAQPPKREWVGLTDEDKQSIVNKKAEGAYLSVMQTIELTEAKLKEKNT